MSSSGPSLAKEGAHRCVGAPDGGSLSGHGVTTALSLPKSVLMGACPSRAGGSGPARPGRGQSGPPSRPPAATALRAVQVPHWSLLGAGSARPAHQVWSCALSEAPSRRRGLRQVLLCLHTWPSLSGGRGVQSEGGPSSSNEQVKALLGASCWTFVSPTALPAPHGSACPHRCGAESQRVEALCRRDPEAWGGRGQHPQPWGSDSTGFSTGSGIGLSPPLCGALAFRLRRGKCHTRGRPCANLFL